MVDADPKGAFALLNSRRTEGALPLASAERGLERPLEVADFLGYDWVLIGLFSRRHVSVERRDAVAVPAE